MFYGDSNLSRRSASGSSVQPEYMSGKTPTFSPQVRYRPLGERLKIILDRVVLSSRFFYSPGAQRTLDCCLAVGRPKMNGLVSEIMGRFDHADRSAASPHQNGMGHRGVALEPYAAQKRAIAYAGCAKNNVFTSSQVLCVKNSLELLSKSQFDNFLLFVRIAGPHHRLHVSA